MNKEYLEEKSYNDLKKIAKGLNINPMQKKAILIEEILKSESKSIESEITHAEIDFKKNITEIDKIDGSKEIIENTDLKIPNTASVVTTGYEGDKKSYDEFYEYIKIRFLDKGVRFDVKKAYDRYLVSEVDDNLLGNWIIKNIM